MGKKLAVLLTCHNRRNATLKCIQCINQQVDLDNVKIDIYLVDDGSTDGTSIAVKTMFPNVKIIKGDGKLFWNKGMRLGITIASKHDYNFYLWLNDDTMLFKTSLSLVLRTYEEILKVENHSAIIVGSTRDANSGETTYGGLTRPSTFKRLKFSRIIPTDKPEPCETMNGNCVLVPRDAFQIVGNLDPEFTHGMGDIDYGLRAGKQGIKIWVAPGHVGECSNNSLKNTYMDMSLSLKKRFALLTSVKGLPPKEWRVFTKRYAGFLWYAYWVKPYIKCILKKYQ